MEDQKAPAIPTEIVSTENILEVPEFAKPVAKEVEAMEVVKTPEETKTIEPEVAPVVELDEQAVLQKRLQGAISEVEKKNEEVRRVVDLQAELVTDNPDFIHKIAASDPILANKVIQKVWGGAGIRSYKQLQERVKLEQIKETSPELYETKSKMLQIEADLEARKVKDQTRTREEFLKIKGIQNNEYDPKFQKIQQAMESLNPSLIEQDYEKALEMASRIALGDYQPVVSAAQPPIQATIGVGNKPAPMPAVKLAVSEQSSWLADQLNKKRGYSITL